jgi:hypothetical protein
VANILSTYGVTHLATLQAAVLHDTVEDTDTDLEEIAREFGDEVARIVEVSLFCEGPLQHPVKPERSFHLTLRDLMIFD